MSTSVQNFKEGNLKYPDFVWMIPEESTIEYWIYQPESWHPLMSIKKLSEGRPLVNDHEPIDELPTVAFTF